MNGQLVLSEVISLVSAYGETQAMLGHILLFESEVAPLLAEKRSGPRKSNDPGFGGNKGPACRSGMQS